MSLSCTKPYIENQKSQRDNIVLKVPRDTCKKITGFDFKIRVNVVKVTGSHYVNRKPQEIVSGVGVRVGDLCEICQRVSYIVSA